MKSFRSTAAVAALLCAANSLSAFDTAADIRKDVQLRAMIDELARSKTLQLNNLDKPYFIEYTTGDADQLYISASLGGITSSNRLRTRSPRLDVRVGDYKFDNTNSVFTGTPRFGGLPIDDDYSALRTALWMTTDTLYKASADQITRKRNALREIADPDKTPDLAPAKPVQFLQPPGVLNIDAQHWEEWLRRASGRFASFPSVIDSNVRLRAITSTYRLVNSEGTVVRVPQELSDISIRASGLATDGSRVWSHAFITALRPSQFPSAEQLDKIVQAVASDTDALTKAPVMTDYSGPVLFEQEAAAQMMASMLADAVRLHRRPLAPPGSRNNGEVLESVWATRIGAKVVPDWLTIYDNPLQEQLQGVPLAGHYQIDDEGVPAEQVMLVEKGTLKGFLSSREPVREFNASNGHGRLPEGFGAEAPVIGNLFVQASQTVSEKQMRAKLLEKVKAAGLKYGIVLRSLDFPSTASINELQSLGRQLQKGGFARTLNPPLLAYRLYLDGHEELVRGIRFREFSAKDLRDVALASDRPYVLNYVNNGSSFNYAEASSDATTSTVICPSLLFDSIDLARAEDEPGKLPVVPPPALVAQQ
ncbi:MAG TPA: metallopeptidase TldD-related protein [Bryobacteraceae bacterium]|nr:metallopeptidase TldD-related protein [Bryobacteraceae bacterium]